MHWLDAEMAAKLSLCVQRISQMLNQLLFCIASLA
jgi:hypothetical protein